MRDIDWEKTLGATNAAMVRAAAEQRAAVDVDLAIEFLERLGVIEPQCVRMKQSKPVPMDVMLKAASLMRLRQWQEANQLSGLDEQVPEPDAVIADMKLPLQKQKVNATALAKRVFGVWFSQMAWTALGPRADVVVRDVRSAPIVDELAQMLWDFRHLADFKRKED